MNLLARSCCRRSLRRRVVSVVLAGPLLAVAGCGNLVTTEVNGAVGVAAGESGAPRLVLTICSGEADVVVLYRRRGGPADVPEEPVGIWRRDVPATAAATLDLRRPGPRWALQRDPGRLEPAVVYDASAYADGEDSELSQVGFEPGRLGEVPAGQVRVRGRLVPVGDLRETVCG